jgi:aldehyde:ferredoxin oxidoreductase
MGTILRVDLSSGVCSLRDLAPEEQRLGGRGLSSHLVSGLVPPNADPLGPDNVLVVAAGLLAGTTVPNSGRLSLGAKSPLTGTIKESNSGGSVARRMARLGIRAIIVEGKAEHPCLIHVSTGGASLHRSAELVGMGTAKTIGRLRQSGGDDIGVVCIGPAGERELKAAGAIVTASDFRLRSAARGGLGAVMGSKNLKAIVVNDKGAAPPAVAKPELMKQAVSALCAGIQQNPTMSALEGFGSAFLVGLANELGCLPTKNFSIGRFAAADEISGEKMSAILSRRPNARTKHRCMSSCIVYCSQVYTDDEGREITSGFDYDTLGMLGANCLISDLDLLARMDGLCDDLGLDPIEVGAALALAMEAGVIEWGDGPAAYRLIAETVVGSEHGTLIGNGCVATGTALGVTRIPAVKGQSFAAWDPRVLKGTGVTYATSPMGADHTAGNAVPSAAAPGYDPSSPLRQNEVSRYLQAYNAAIDTLGFCLFPGLALLDKPDLQVHLAEAVEARTGLEIDKENYLQELGASVLAEEAAFNRAAGFTSADDRLPSFVTQEALPPSGQIFDVSSEDIDSVLP